MQSVRRKILKSYSLKLHPHRIKFNVSRKLIFHASRLCKFAFKFCDHSTLRLSERKYIKIPSPNITKSPKNST